MFVHDEGFPGINLWITHSTFFQWCDIFNLPHTHVKTAARLLYRDGHYEKFSSPLRNT